MKWILAHLGMDPDDYWYVKNMNPATVPTIASNVKDKVVDKAKGYKDYVLGSNKVQCTTFACISVVTTFLPLFLFHIWMMIYPLNLWCNGNQILIGYSWFTLIQMIISYLYALESPLWKSWSTNMRWVIIAPGLVSGGIWLV